MAKSQRSVVMDKLSSSERPWEFMANGLDFALGLWRLHTMPC
jgi:hypothetical protein